MFDCLCGKAIWNDLSSDVFVFTGTATTELYTLSLHDALPIFVTGVVHRGVRREFLGFNRARNAVDRKSTRLNSSHPSSSYAVLCLKKKTTTKTVFRSVPKQPAAAHVRTSPPCSRHRLANAYLT